MSRLLHVLAALAVATSSSAADKKVEDAVARAESQIAKGRTDEAEKTMEKLVQQLPTAEAHSARARIQLKAGNVEGAAASAAEAVKQSGAATPEVKADALALLASLDLERGSGKDAVAHAGEAAKLAPTAANLAVLARAQARQGDPLAVETGTKAVAAGAQSAAAQEALGQALLAVQRGDEAAAAFRKALTIEPKRGSARAGLANALVATGKAAEAVIEAKKATEDNDKSGEAFAAYANALYAAAANKEQGWNEAVNQAQQGAFLSPRNATVLTTVARLFEATGNYDQAATNYRQALEADPGYVPAQLGALEIESRKDPAAALPRVQALVKQQPQNAALQYLLGKLLARKDQWAEAVEPLERAAPAMANVAEVQALLGRAYLGTGRPEEALAAYAKAVQLAPSNLDYRSTYGLLLGLNDQHADGIAELKKVTGDPSYKEAAAWVNLGWLYRDVEPKRLVESIAAYERGLQIDAENAQAALGLGWAYAMAETYDPAISSFRKAIELDKITAGEAYNGIGWSFYFKKDYKQARAAAEMAQAAKRPVKQLLNEIDKAQRLPQAPVPPPRWDADALDIGALCQQLQRGSPRARVGAAKRLARGGSAAAECLVYAVSTDADFVVRMAAAASLGVLGPDAGREACVQLKGILSRRYVSPLVATKEEMENELRYADLQRAAQMAVARIGCS